MKVKIELDMTPEEFRRAMGWPDLQQMQQGLQLFQGEFFKKMHEHLDQNSESYDANNLFQPYLQGSVQSMEAFQQLMMNAFSQMVQKNENMPKKDAETDSVVEDE